MSTQLGSGMTSQRTRERLVERLRREGIRDERVLEVMRLTPRHLFVDEALASRAYEDNSLPIGHGQTISQPYIVARMTEALLAAGPMDVVLEVGTGSGYQTAVLAPLVRRIYTVERISALLEQARVRIRQLKYGHVHLKHSDGGLGLPEHAPFDGIIVAAASGEVPKALIDQLRPGGRLVCPVARAAGRQELVRITKLAGGGSREEILEPVVFVPMLSGLR